jgi:hypothetical protein
MEIAIVVAIFGAGVAAVGSLPFLLPKIFRPPQRVNGFKTRMKDCPYPASIVALALATFTDEWDATFSPDKRVDAALDRVNIYWKDVEYFIASDGRTKAAGETKTIAALPKPYHNITVATKDRTLGQTAFFHELTHVMLAVTTGDPDRNHREGKGPWQTKHDTFINNLKKAFQ